VTQQINQTAARQAHSAGPFYIEQTGDSDSHFVPSLLFSI
jgi:hypothetical protein